MSWNPRCLLYNNRHVGKMLAWVCGVYKGNFEIYLNKTMQGYVYAQAKHCMNAIDWDDFGKKKKKNEYCYTYTEQIP